MHDKVLIVDFGSQVTQLIARRVREEKVYCEIVPFQKAEAAFREMNPKAVILSGGPASVLDKDAPMAPKAIYDAGLPVLGICYGEQAMAQQLGGKVEGGHHREFGRAEVTVTEDALLFEGIWRKGEKYPVWMSHGDRVTKLPDGFRTLGTSPNSPIASWISTAATAESTPPDRPQITRPLPTCLRIFSIASSLKARMVQSPVSPATLRTKLRNSAAPCGVCITSR